MPHGATTFAGLLALDTDPLERSLQSVMNSLVSATKKSGEVMTKNTGKTWKKIGAVIGGVGNIGMVVAQAFGVIGTMGLDTIGIFIQFADAIGILEPIISIITGVLELMGGAAMTVLAPAIQKLAAVLFSPQMMAIWTQIGTVIGNFLGTIINAISILLSDPDFQKVLGAFIKILENVFGVILNVFGWFFDWIAGMDPSEIGALFYAFGIAIAFLVGVLHGGLWGAILGASYAILAAAALFPLTQLQHGGYVGASQGGTPIIVAEGGEGEFVIPESKMAGIMDNEGVIWAIEDLGYKMDRTNRLLGQRGRLR